MFAEPTTRSKNRTPRPSKHSWTARYLSSVAALLVLYFITAKLGLLMDAVSGFATTVWPPAGISLAALSLLGYRLWPGIAIGAFFVNISAGAPFLAACGMATGNTLEAIVGTYLLRRFAGFRGSLDRIPCVVGFVVLAAGLSTTVSATMGVTSGWLGGVIPSTAFGRAWLTWWLGDALGDLIVAPLLFAWAEWPHSLLSPRRLVEAGAMFGSLVMVSLLAFGPLLTPEQSIFLQPYVILPFLIWAALRFGQHGTVMATFVVASMAIWKTAQGVGPFARGTVNDLLFLQGFMGVVAVTMLLFAAGVSERRRAEVRLRVNHSLARVLADTPTLEEVLPAILRAICESLGWDCGNAWKVDAERSTLRHAAEWHGSHRRLGRFGETAVG